MAPHSLKPGQFIPTGGHYLVSVLDAQLCSVSICLVNYEKYTQRYLVKFVTYLLISLKMFRGLFNNTEKSIDFDNNRTLLLQVFIFWGSSEEYIHIVYSIMINPMPDIYYTYIRMYTLCVMPAMCVSLYSSCIHTCVSIVSHQLDLTTFTLYTTQTIYS